MRDRTIAALIFVGLAVVLAWPTTASAHRNRRGLRLVRNVRVAGPVYRVQRSPARSIRRAPRIRRVPLPYRRRWVAVPPAAVLPPPMIEVHAEPIVGLTITPGYPMAPGPVHYAEEVVVDCHW